MAEVRGYAQSHLIATPCTLHRHLKEIVGTETRSFALDLHYSRKTHYYLCYPRLVAKNYIRLAELNSTSCKGWPT